ncbi:DUF817 domain-containing protein [Aeromicrobium sp. Leaf350]|uniref:DUF817 domain-containing protein n=1 Tax=Aeromicrobium sp. Leaf350 TaxID=2876565 RepID=UPI001E382C9C|nr:DUF817 domain-containing protein [Aeromicrobium sp. Leaf350]
MRQGPGGDATSLELRLLAWARGQLEGAPSTGWRGGVVELLVFGVKQAWACVFGALMLLVLVVTAVAYPEGAALDRNDALVLLAVLIQLGMVLGRLETGRELWVVVLFHVAGTGMELFKTSVGSWSYEGGGVLHLGSVPLYSGFMYAAVGSYMVRVMRLFDLRFSRYPPLWASAVVAVCVYVNFFTHHYVLDARYVLLAAVVLLWGRCVMHFRVHRHVLRMPVVVAFALVAFFIWIAENVATAAGAWFYPSQLDGWEMVPFTKFVSWFLLMIISVVLVTFVYRPREPADAPA